ncbi:TPA: DUF551 domain-containing protein [Klebsiella pneumoniae]
MTSKLTRERLEKIKSWRETYGAGSNVMLPAEEAEELARIALAAMESEPVAWRRFQETPTDGGYWILYDYRPNCSGVEPLYRHAQPAPKYPEVLPCSVLLEPGLRFGKGIKTCTMLAALARRAVHESDMAALSPEERAEFQAGIEDFKSLIAQQPVVPDEKPMPNSLSMYAVDAVAAIAEVKGWNACRAAMLADAPQLPGSEPATVPGKWIPVSEQMPPSRHEVLVGRWWGEKPRWCCKWATYIPGHPDAQSSGWLIPGASWTPTHWMPLPAGPQEVKGE